ncbi:hypothetical protein TWF718_010795 [Orbilia javanica]|uniref:Uncharacterized protein n=1 Tax=Orbilia javanica TaxID=47235 RepID=A0AAN8RBZ1_9PEZI
MQILRILLATFIAGVLAAPSARISKRTNLLTARHECEETPTNCDPYYDPEDPEDCHFCCADSVVPLGADCHLDGVVSCDTQSDGPGLVWHCDDPHRRS